MGGGGGGAVHQRAAMYAKLFERGGAVSTEGRQCMRSCLNGEGGGAVRLRLYTKTGGGGGGGRAVGKLNEPIRHSHARILY